MNVRPHPRYAEFVHRIRTLSPAPARWAGVTFRSVELGHASPNKIFSRGRQPKIWWTRERSRNVSGDLLQHKPGTAVEEAFQLAADYELSPDDLKPRVTCAIEWDLARVIDLTQKNYQGG